jgi:hypothetical protein
VSEQGLGGELFVYLATDPADGVTGPLWWETAGGARMPLLAETRRKADAMRPIAERLARTTGADVVLARFGSREDIDTIRPT